MLLVLVKSLDITVIEMLFVWYCVDFVGLLPSGAKGLENVILVPL